MTPIRRSTLPTLALCLALVLTIVAVPAAAQEDGAYFPPLLVQADEALRAGEATRALELVRQFQEGGALAEFVPLALFERALAAAQLGDLDEAACLYSQAAYLNDWFARVPLDAYPEGPALATRVRIAEPRDASADGFTRPRGIETAMPAMTDRLAAQMAEAPVVLKTIVTADGRTVVHSVVETPHGEAALAAIEGVCRWRFEPATNAAGTPVPVWFEVRFGGPEGTGGS